MDDSLRKRYVYSQERDSFPTKFQSLRFLPLNGDFSHIFLNINSVLNNNLDGFGGNSEKNPSSRIFSISQSVFYRPFAHLFKAVKKGGPDGKTFEVHGYPNRLEFRGNPSDINNVGLATAKWLTPTTQIGVRSNPPSVGIRHVLPRRVVGVSLGGYQDQGKLRMWALEQIGKNILVGSDLNVGTDRLKVSAAIGLRDVRIGQKEQRRTSKGPLGKIPEQEGIIDSAITVHHGGQYVAHLRGSIMRESRPTALPFSKLKTAFSVKHIQIRPCGGVYASQIKFKAGAVLTYGNSQFRVLVAGSQGSLLPTSLKLIYGHNFDLVRIFTGYGFGSSRYSNDNGPLLRVEFDLFQIAKYFGWLN